MLFPPGFEPGTFRVWGERDNHYTTETCGHLRITVWAESVQSIRKLELKMG